MLAKPQAQFTESKAMEMLSLRKILVMFQLVSAMEVFYKVLDNDEVVVNVTLLGESTLALGYYRWQDQGQSIGQNLGEGLEEAIDEAYQVGISHSESADFIWQNNDAQ